MEIPMINVFQFEDGQKIVDENLTKPELLEVIEQLLRERGTFEDMVRRQRERAARLNNVTPIRTPFLDLVALAGGSRRI